MGKISPRLAIQRKKFSVWLNAQSAKTGSVQFGSTSPSKYTGRLTGVPLNLDAKTGLWPAGTRI